MNYDNWKLASPDEYYQVSRCCGAEVEDPTEEELEEDFEHEYKCVECNEGCEVQDLDEYQQDRHESYLEDCADDERHERNLGSD
tara:strand:+ start:25 stop:276 length:252 start_codon:yes stop_codon:yes gene_type:complete